MKHAVVLNLLAYRYILLATLAVLVAFQALTGAISHPLAVSPLTEGSSASNESSTVQIEMMDLPASRNGIVALVEKPLFSRTRRPYVPPPPEQAPTLMEQVQPQTVAPEPQLTLQGIFIQGSIRRALVLTPENPAPTWLREGDDIAAWRLAEIKPNKLILQAGEKQRAIELYVEKP